ncbi:unnamed protein product, partial [Didymodactylos carnosus]
ITVPYSDDTGKRIRVFPLTQENDDYPPRINETYDECISYLKQEEELLRSRSSNAKAKDRKLTATEKEAFRRLKAGHRGVCSLRQLRYFDTGRSFASDSLHNLYHVTAADVMA